MITYLQYLYNLRSVLAKNFRQYQLVRSWQQKGVGIDTTVMIRLATNSFIDIGEGTTIGAYTILDLLNDPQDADATESKVIIGKRVAINEFNNIRASGGEIRIGDGCLVSQFVSIIGSNHSISKDAYIRDQAWDLSKAGVTIDGDVWIGANVVILPGVHIARGAIIAAGAVVTNDVPEYAIAAGVPAKVVSHRE